jgi:hypothetical protein
MVAKKVDEEPDAWVEPKEPVSERDALTVTLKAGGGYDAPWLVFHANGIAEAIEWLQHEDLEELQDLAARRGKEFAKAFGGPVAASKAPASSGGGNWGNKAKAASGSAERPSGTCSVHNCDLVFADGFTKRDGSKVNARVGCPVPKCYSDTVWQNDDGTWGK